MKRLKIIATFGTIICLASIVGVLAYTFWQDRVVINTGKIVAFNNIQVYSDSACTVVLTALAWPQTMNRNTNYTQNLWIKNLGDEGVWCSWNSTGLPTGCTTTMKNGSQNWEPSNQGIMVMDIGALWPCEYKLCVNGSVAFGNVAWTLFVHGEKS